jgi:predicted nucleic acid-binding protein
VKGETWVLDCSAVAAFLLSEAEGATVDPLIRRAASEDVALLVPALFWFELVNVLLVAQRRGRITQAQALQLRRESNRLPVTTDLPPGTEERSRLHDLALSHKLTAYDAAYLELAERRGARLKTFDPDLLGLRETYPWIE